MTETLLTLIGTALLNNFVLHWPLGVEPLLASERRQVHALGIATTCLMLITGVLGPGANAHGPNEFLHLPTAERLSGCVAQVLDAHARRIRP